MTETEISLSSLGLFLCVSLCKIDQAIMLSHGKLDADTSPIPQVRHHKGALRKARQCPLISDKYRDKS